MSGFSTLYWINPYGKILKQQNTTHIQGVTKNPKTFGVTREWIEQIYKKHNEPVGTEGNAREEIMEYLFKKGYTRVRLYVNKYWSITLSNFRNRRVKKSLSKWAEDAAEDKSSGKFMPVRILDTKTNKMYADWTVNDIKFDRHINEDDSLEGMDLFAPEIITEFEDLTIWNIGRKNNFMDFI